MRHEVTLGQALAFALGMSAFGFYYVLKTKLGERRPDYDPCGYVYNIRLFVKGAAWVFAIGGLLVAFRVLLMMLDG